MQKLASSVATGTKTKSRQMAGFFNAMQKFN
jgi:hypothetical protein